MKRKLILLNLVLIAAIAAVGWRLRQDRLERDAHQRAKLEQRVPPLPPPPAPPPLPSPSVTAAGYVDIAQKMLWTKDRNPQVVVEPPAPPKPPPALPSLNGVMNVGDGPIFMITEKAGAAQKAVRVGDRFGEYKLTAVSGSELVLAWEDKTIRRKIEELLDRRDNVQVVEAPGSQASGSTPAPPPPPPQATCRPGPGVDVGAGLRSCQACDTSPAGTVADGFRKLITPTPFGNSCRWETVK